MAETKQEKCVARFNAAHPVGTPVQYRSSPSALALNSRTASEAWVLGGHTPVVMLDNVRGCVAVDALTVARARSSSTGES